MCYKNADKNKNKNKYILKPTNHMTMINNPIEVMFSELVEFNYLEILELITKKKKKN